MQTAWIMPTPFQTSYNQLHGTSIHNKADLSKINDPKRFKTNNDPVLVNCKENKHNDFLTMSQISYKEPNSKSRPFTLLNTNQSGFVKNNLNNDGLTYYYKRNVDMKDMRLTEFKNKFRPFN